MRSRLLRHLVLAALTALAIVGVANNQRAMAQEVPYDGEARPYCTEDAMIVFDASGSMAGNTVQGLFSDKTRIGEVRAALSAVLPDVTRFPSLLFFYRHGCYFIM